MSNPQVEVERRPVYSITDAKDNADLIVVCRDLGYIPEGADVLDATYGLGRFWSKWRPAELWTNDLDPSTDAQNHHDFRNFDGVPDEVFEVVVFDPPYGYRGTSRLASDSDYGLGEYLSVEAREKLMADGMTECARVLAKGGRLLMKVQDQNVSAEKRFQTIMFANLGEHLKLELEDMLHLRSVRAQPAGKSQCHSWANYSTLLIFSKP